MRYAAQPLPMPHRVFGMGTIRDGRCLLR